MNNVMIIHLYLVQGLYTIMCLNSPAEAELPCVLFRSGVPPFC